MMRKYLDAAVLIGIGMTGAAHARAEPSTIGLVKAVRTAEAQTGGGAFEAELEDESGKAFYEVKLANGKRVHEVRIDASTGAILSSVRPRLANWLRGWSNDDRPSKPKRIGSMLETIERQTHGSIREIGFDVEHGSEVYEIEVATAKGVAELRIDAATGKRMPLRYDD